VSPSPTKLNLVKTLHCASCGAPQELRAGPRSQVLICAYCDSTIDLTDPTFKVLHQYQQRIKFEPFVPLGARGTLRDETLECIGYMRRTVTIEGIDYTWSEYLLHNPYKGYRWLTEYNGHWSLVKECPALPLGPGGLIADDPPQGGSINYMGTPFKHFQSASARVTYCIGEFYWRVAQDDRAMAHDYVNPPYTLSCELAGDDVTWSLSEYVAGREISQAFKLPNVLPTVGVAPNQPNPIDVKRLWTDYALFCALSFLLTLVFAMFCADKQVFEKTWLFNANEKERATVTDFFELGGRSANVEIDVKTNLDNRWAFFQLALINAQTNTAIDFGVDASYYHGVEDGESWSEGSADAEAVVPSVPAGRYYLRIDPESGTGDSPDAYQQGQPEPGAELFHYAVTVRRDVVQWWYMLVIWIVLLPWPIIQSIRRASFEGRRWAESDHAPSSD